MKQRPGRLGKASVFYIQGFGSSRLALKTCMLRMRPARVEGRCGSAEAAEIQSRVYQSDILKERSLVSIDACWGCQGPELGESGPSANIFPWCVQR